MVFLFLSLFSVLFNSPSVFFSPPSLSFSLTPSSLSQYESLYLAYLVWGLSFIYVLLLLSPPSVTSTVPACSFLMAWRKTLLYLELTSPHTAVPEMKSGKIMFKSCRRCFAADAGYANPQPHKCWFFPKQLLLKRTLKYRNLLYSSRIYFTNSIVNSHSLLLSPFGCFSV